VLAAPLGDLGVLSQCHRPAQERLRLIELARLEKARAVPVLHLLVAGKQLGRTVKMRERFLPGDVLPRQLRPGDTPVA